MKRNILNTLIILILITGFNSCLDYLDVSKELAAEMNEKDVFDNPDNIRKFHRNIMAGTIDPSLMYMNNNNAFKNPWPYLSDELTQAHNQTPNSQAVQGFNPATAGLHRWQPCYQYIRQANLFIERAHPILNPGGISEFLESEYQYLKAIAYFYRAYYHYLLFELYGPVPVMDQSVKHDDTNLDFARNSVDEVVEFIDGELKKLIDGSGDYAGLKEKPGFVIIYWRQCDLD